MLKNYYRKKISDCIVTFNSEDLVKAINEAINNGVSVHEILDAMDEGMKIVGNKYEAGEFFLAELIMAGETMKSGLEVIRPLFKKVDQQSKGKVVIGTVAGDLHDIGKNLVIYFLQSAGFEVYDLGVDVSEEEFVNKVRELEPDILAMSALLLSTMSRMKTTIEALIKAGLRDKIKIMVGGRPVTADFAREIGADAYAKTAIEAVKVAENLIR